MHLVQATCPRCHDVTVPATCVTVLLYEDSDLTAYRFDCPVCDLEVVRTTRRDLVGPLQEAGCEVVTCDDVPETSKRIHPSQALAPLFNEADVERFSNLLETENWFDDLVKLTS